MNTLPELDIDGFFDNIISSYETRIQKIQTAFQASENLTESSHTLFNNVHNQMIILKKEREFVKDSVAQGQQVISEAEWRNKDAQLNNINNQLKLWKKLLRQFNK